MNKPYLDFNMTYGCMTQDITADYVRNRSMMTLSEVMETLDEVCDTYSISLSKASGKEGVVTVNEYTLKDSINIPNVIKELTDVIYVTGQGMLQMDINLDAAFKEVHRSNMSKAILPTNKEFALAQVEKHRNGKYPDAVLVHKNGMLVIMCESSKKILKPDSYSPAFITEKEYML